MKADALKQMIDELTEAEKKLIHLIAAREGLNFSGHQDVVSVSVGKTTLTASYLERSTGRSSRAIRGMEMIILGMQKVFNAKIDAQNAEIAKLKLSIVNQSLIIAKDYKS